MAASFAPTRTGWHPLHGILSAFPIAFFTGALLSDIAYARTAQIMWADFSIWLITGGLLFGTLAVIAGILEALLMRGRARGRRRTSWLHGIGTVVMLGLALINAFIHSRDAWTSVVPTGITLSTIVALLALVTGWIGYSVDTRERI